MLSTMLVANETSGQFEITYNLWSDTVDGKHIYHQVTKVKRRAAVPEANIRQRALGGEHDDRYDPNGLSCGEHFVCQARPRDFARV